MKLTHEGAIRSHHFRTVLDLRPFGRARIAGRVTGGFFAENLDERAEVLPEPIREGHATKMGSTPRLR